MLYVIMMQTTKKSSSWKGIAVFIAILSVVAILAVLG